MTKFKEVSLMNAFLCLCVVMMHLTVEPLGLWEVTTLKHILVFSLNKGLSFAVPAFLFLSGLKLHNKFDGKNVDVKQFYLGRVKKLVLPYVVCVLVYFLYLWWKGWAQPKYLPGYVFLGTLVAHFYYIIIAVQLYFVFPWLKLVFDRFPKTVTALATLCSIIMLVYFVHLPYMDRFVGTYIVYFVLGMAFSRYKLYEKLKNAKWVYVASFLGLFVLGLIYIRVVYLMSNGWMNFRFHDLLKMLFVIVAIVFLYGTFQRLADKSLRLVAISEVISETSFSIYLYHIMLLYLLRNDLLRLLDLSVWGRFAVASMVMYGAIFAYSYGVRYVKKTLKSRTLSEGRSV